MGLEAFCQTQTCRRFFIFDLDRLIASAGADFLVSDIPAMKCEFCGGALENKLVVNHPSGES
jgi:hypothetical protein